MKNLSNNELNNVKGGFSVWSGVAIAAIVVFLSGVFEGFTNPGRCNNETE